MLLQRLYGEVRLSSREIFKRILSIKTGLDCCAAPVSEALQYLNESAWRLVPKFRFQWNLRLPRRTVALPRSLFKAAAKGRFGVALLRRIARVVRGGAQNFFPVASVHQSGPERRCGRHQGRADDYQAPHDAGNGRGI